MLSRVIAFAAITLAAAAGHAGNFDGIPFPKGPADVRWHLAEGAVVCPFASSLDEAYKAAARNDTPWLISTGCAQAFGKPSAILIHSVGATVWQVRAQWAPDFGRTYYVSIAALMTNQGGKEIAYPDFTKRNQDDYWAKVHAKTAAEQAASNAAITVSLCESPELVRSMNEAILRIGNSHITRCP